MRVALFFAAILPGLVQEKTSDDAEALFRKVERKLHAASRVDISLAHEAHVDTDIQDQAEARFTTWWNETGRRQEWHLEEGRVKGWIIDRPHGEPTLPPGADALELWKRLYRHRVSANLSGGVQSWGEAWCPLLDKAPEPNEKPVPPFAVVSGFKWLPKEPRVDGQPIEFTLMKKYRSGTRTRTIRLWIDEASLRPLKLRATYGSGRTARVSIETYSRYETR